MGTSAATVRFSVRVVRIVITVVAMLALAPSVGHATPGFARQTGISCQACHTVFPELTPFGRKFKLNAYVFTNVQQLEPINEQSQRILALSELAPISLQLQGSNTTLAKSIPDIPASDLSQKNSTQFPQALSIFYTGKIAPDLGAFLQVTWTPENDSIGIDNSELRFADHADLGAIGMKDFIYGITLNNNPTVQDVWNSTPAWGQPFIATNVAVPSQASVLLDQQLAGNSVGLGAYLYLLDHLYIELSGYRSSGTGFTNTTTGGPGPLDSTAGTRINGVAAPYWRVAWEQDWGNHSLEVGTVGMYASTHPAGVGEHGVTDRFTDLGLDGQYQYITDRHIASFQGVWIHERESFNNAGLTSTNREDWLNTVRLTGNYFFRRRIGGMAQLFSTTGRSDPTRYPFGTPATGSRTSKPDTQGATLEVDFLPWLNTKLGAQYTLYTKFNGTSRDYDAFGRNAGDNNTLFVYIWTAF